MNRRNYKIYNLLFEGETEQGASEGEGKSKTPKDGDVGGNVPKAELMNLEKLLKNPKGRLKSGKKYLKVTQYRGTKKPSNNVMLVQQFLRGAGYYTGKIDGVGRKGKAIPGWVQALFDFQKEHGLDDDGSVGPKTAAAMQQVLDKNAFGRPISYKERKKLGDQADAAQKGLQDRLDDPAASASTPEQLSAAFKEEDEDLKGLALNIIGQLAKDIAGHDKKAYEGNRGQKNNFQIYISDFIRAKSIGTKANSANIDDYPIDKKKLDTFNKYYTVTYEKASTGTKGANLNLLDDHFILKVKVKPKAAASYGGQYPEAMRSFQQLFKIKGRGKEKGSEKSVERVKEGYKELAKESFNRFGKSRGTLLRERYRRF